MSKLIDLKELCELLLSKSSMSKICDFYFGEDFFKNHCDMKDFVDLLKEVDHFHGLDNCRLDSPFTRHCNFKDVKDFDFGSILHFCLDFKFLYGIYDKNNKLLKEVSLQKSSLDILLIDAISLNYFYILKYCKDIDIDLILYNTIDDLSKDKLELVYIDGKEIAFLSIHMLNNMEEVIYPKLVSGKDLRRLYL